MFEAFRGHRDDDAESTARALLEYPELPIIIRLRACAVIASCDFSNYLEMAHEALRHAMIASSDARAGAVDQELLDACKDLFAQAQTLNHSPHRKG